MWYNYTMSNRIKNIFSILDHDIPDAAIELEYDGTPYTLLVAVILSAQSTDRQVNKVTDVLFQVADTPEKILSLGYDKLCEYVGSVGLYKTKAKNIIAASEMILSRYGGQVPVSKEELMSLPGVGLKSANIMLNVVHKKPTIPVDTHVFRVATRLNLSQMKTRDRMSHDLETELPKHLDDSMMQKAHHLMVLHGRYTCKAIKPLCDRCPIYDLCHAKDKRPLA